MRGSKIEFFADSKDWQKIINELGTVPELLFVSRCSRLNESNVQFTCASKLGDYVCSFEAMRGLEAFLITKRNAELMQSSVSMKDGSGTKTVYNQGFNPDSVVLFPGVAISNLTLVASNLSTTAETAYAKELFTLLKKIILQDTVKHSGYYLHSGAREKLMDGWRLAPREQYPKNGDLSADALK